MDFEDYAENRPSSSRDATSIEDGNYGVVIHPTRKKKFARPEKGSAVPGGRTVYLKTYGCGHNVSDGEVMAGLLAEQGYNVTDDLEDPNIDAFLLNSCSVKNPSESAFRDLAKKCQSRERPVIVAGCVPQADNKGDQWNDFSVIGVQAIERVVEVVEQALDGNKIHLLTRSKKSKPSLDLPKIRRNKFIEIIPINLGCLGDCTYCKTKMARGTLVSYAVEEIVARVKQCVEEGVREVRLTSEDAGAYGLDIGTNIVELLEAVLAVLPDGVMLKLGMSNPPYMLNRLEGIARCLNHPRMYKFLHLPVQSGSDHVLAAMKREYTVEEFSRVCDTLLRLVPGLQIATDVICGFPGETEEDFEETMNLVRKYRFPILNLSQFYPRPGTVAARMQRVPTQIVKERSRRLSELFNDGISDPYASLLGSQQRVWITETAHDGHNLCGHTQNYTQVIVPPKGASMGTDVQVQIVETGRFFVRGEVLENGKAKKAAVIPKKDSKQVVDSVKNSANITVILGGFVVLLLVVFVAVIVAMAKAGKFEFKKR